MTCPDCEQASRQLWHAYSTACEGCQARQLARSSHFFRVRKNESLDRRYLNLLESMKLTHKQVKDAADNDYMGKA